jgi:hypothetical protein
VKEPGGGLIEYAYGFDLEIGKNGARASFGLARRGGTALHVVRVRVGRTGSTVSAYRTPANMQGRVDFWPPERSGEAADIGGRLCPAPCADPRFNP